VGPTLSASDVQAILPAVCLPPAAQGSVVRAVRDFDPSAILLIDGTFQQEPAVRHKEILWAMAQGVTVLGAASMGALRAAELCRYGMIGVGLIFRWYRRYVLLPDDAVAVLHSPAELGHRALTRSLVDLRMTVRAAERRCLIDRRMRDRIEDAAKALGFRDRTLANVVEHALEKSGEHGLQTELVRILNDCFVDQKRADALAALHLLRTHCAEGGSLPRQPPKFDWTTAFLADLAHADIDPFPNPSLQSFSKRLT